MSTPSTSTPRRIFLSYGHDHYSTFAERLKEDLERGGHEVWFDIKRLTPGGDWEAYIAEGLEWASLKQGEGRFLLLMTPHSVRRPDGYCLNELSRALERNLMVIPVIVATAEVPLSINRIQRLDFRDCQPPDQHPELYEKKLAQLLDAIETGELDFDGVQSRLIQRLRPIAFEGDIEHHLRAFIGRRWIIDEFEKWIAAQAGSKVFWLTGNPGIGKSAISAKLIATRPEISAIHLCRFGHAEKSDPRRAVQSIAFQLSTQLPDYAQRLNALDLDRLAAETDAGTLFDLLITQPLARDFPVPAQTHVVLVDALDEATRENQNALAKLIASEVPRSPDWLRFFVTSREQEEVTYPLQALNPYKLEAARKENQDDLRTYFTEQLKSFLKPGDTQTVEALVRRSEGLFLYAEWVCHEIASGQLSIDHLDKFPHGLGGIYAAFFERQFPDTADYAKRFRPVLEVVAAAREPLQLDYLAGVFNWSDYDIVEIPNAVGSLFSQRFGRLEPFHLSVLDWLKDKNKAGRYFVSVNNGGKRLADHAWDEFLSWSEDRARKVFDYSIIHLPAHLEAVPDGVDKLSKLLMNFDWMQAKLGKTDVVALMKDYRRRDILELAPVRDVLRRAALALQRDRSLLAGQLLGRLPDFIHASLKPLLDGARKNSSDPWLRPKGATLINAGHPLHTTLWGHKGTVRSVAISADGTRAVTAGNSSPDQTLRFWDLEFGVEIARLEGQAEAGSYTPVAVLPNGNWALCAFQNQINVWDLRTAEKTTSLSGHAESVSAVAISSSGDRAISASHTGEVLVWDLTAWRQLGAPLNQGEAVWSVGISADGTIGVSGSENLIKVWDLVQQTELSSFQGQTGYWGRWPRPLLLVGANSFIYFGDPMRVWNWRENTFTPAPENMVGQVLAGDAEGKQLVVYRERQNLELWDFEKPTQIGAIDGTESFLSAVAMTPDRNWLIDAFFDHEVRVWDLAAFSRMDPEGKLIAKLSPIQSWAELRFPVSDQFEASAITPAPEASSTSVTESTAKTIDLSSLRKTAAPARKGPIKRGQPVILGDYFALSFAPEDWVLTIFDVRNGKTITSFVFDAPIRQCSVEPDETIRVSEISGRVHSLVFENPPA